MELLDNVKKNEMIDWARQIEKIVRENNKDLADEITTQIESLGNYKLSIAVVGLLKRGKSTFCNAFLGRNDDTIAPIGRFPATGVITEFMYDDKEYAKVIFANESSIEIPYKDIRAYVTEEDNPQNKKDVLKVEVYGKFPIDQQIKLIDMPGDESIHAYHSEIVYNYLPNADVVIFLSSANDPISATELSLLKKVQPNDMKKVFFVVNKVDKCDDEEINDAIMHDKNTISNAKIEIKNDIYTISAKKALSGDWESSNFNKLFADIKSFLDQDRYKILLSSFYGRILALSHPVIQNMQQQVKFDSMSIADLEDEIKKLEEKKVIMLDEFSNAVSEFSESWDAMLNEFDQALPEIRNNIENSIIKDIEAISRFGINKKTVINIQEQIAQSVEREFQFASGNLEQKAISALDKLNKSCPEITNFLSEQNFELNYQNKPNCGGWCFTLLSGSSALISGAAIWGASSVGTLILSGLPVIGNFLAGITNVVIGSIGALILGPLFLISTIATVIAVSGSIVSTLKKKQLQKENLIVDVKKSIKQMFHSIKIEKIPYLREQKEILIKELKKQFEKTLKNTEKNLVDALDKQKSQTVNKQLQEKRKNLLLEYAELEQYAEAEVVE